jgi:gliding motility associated protien GldN
MNRKNIIGFVFVFVCVLTSYGQANMLNAVTVDEIGQSAEQSLDGAIDKPLPYGYVSDRDILWSTTVWEYIDLNQRINLPLYYPVDTTRVEPYRRSLYHTLLKAVKSGKITEVYDDSYFTTRLQVNEISEKLLRVDTSNAGYDALNAGDSNLSEFVDSIAIQSQDIQGFRIKGIYYFDKRQGELKYRLLGLAPVAQDVQTIGRSDVSDNELLSLFWIFYPDARQVLHEMKVFNEKSSTYPISFDHLLISRRFSSIIYRQENLYGDRDVRDYIKGNSLFQVLESEKLKEAIRDRELDMWNY